MNHANRRLLKEYEIKTYCKPLGRPPKDPRSPKYLKKMAKAVGERNEVECSFGTGKRVYRANNIRAKLPENSKMLERNVLLCQERDEVPQGTLSCSFRN